MKERLKTKCVAALLAGALASTPASADIISWTGATDSDWNTASNWNGATEPGDEDVAEFYSAGAANLDVTVSSGSTIDGLSFNSDAVQPVTLNVTSANPLTLDGGAATQISVLAGSHTIQGAGAGNGDPPEMRVLRGNNEWHVAAGASLAINARLGTDVWPNNNPRYTKTGAGTLTLGNNNSGSVGWNFGGYLGSFTIEEGTLRLTHPVASGDWHNRYTVRDGATLEAAGGIGRVEMRNGNLHLAGDGVDGVRLAH